MAQRHRFGGGLALLAATLVGVSASAALAQKAAGDGRPGSSLVIGTKPQVPHGDTVVGAAPAAAHLERLLLLLEPSAAQHKALDAELKDQQDPSSPQYHHWLTASEFADAYANSASDTAAIVSWLKSEGMSIAPLPAGRGWIEFSGTVAQMEQAFHTQIQTVDSGGGVRFALSGPIAVPAALQTLIHGLVSLDAALAEPAVTTARPVAGSIAELRAATSPSRAEALTPQLAAELLHLDSLQSSRLTGAGESIAIAARSNVEPGDVAAFRAAFGLPANALQVQLDGVDPGRTGDEAAAVMMASWAGAAASGAHIVLVPAATTSATDGLDLALAAIVDQALARTVVVGYSSCEAALSEAHQAFYAALYRQASAEGMAMIAAAGDSGASACQASGGSSPVDSGFGVNALASTPWNTAVGAAALASGGTGSGAAALAGWSPNNPADPAYAGGGGASKLYSVPNWQPLPAHPAAGLPDMNGRLMPDIALPAAIDTGVNPGLVFCLGFSASAPGTAMECKAMRAGGSAAAAAVFAGVAAVIAAKDGPQGNLAPRLYQLSRRTGIFADAEQGNARLSCLSGSPGCDASGLIGFEATAGYDLATGLGSIDAGKLVGEWATPDAVGTGATTVTLSVTPTVPNTTYNPSAQITLTDNVVSGTGGATPTGTVLFADATNGTNLNPSGSTLDANGVANYTFSTGLAQGGNNITANYSGDTTYAAMKSQTLVVSTQPSTTSLTVVPSTTTPTAGLPFTVTVNVTVGSPPAGTVAPTGKVTLNVDGLPTATASFVTAGGVTSATFPSVTINAGGDHPLQAVYAGDPNYGASTSPPVTLTIGKGATVTTLVATPTTLTPGVAESFTATMAPANAAAGATFSITGTVSFYDGTKLLGTIPVNANAASLPNILLTAGVLHSITAVYSGDSSWSASTSNAIALQSALLPDSVTLAVNINTTGPGQVVNLVATVTPVSPPAANIEQNPTGNIIFYNGTTVIGTVALSVSLANSSTATLTTGSLPGGQNVLTAYYVGDLFYAPGTSNAVTITVQDFSIAFSGTPPGDLDIIKGSSGQTPLVVTGLGGFNDLVQLACAVPTQDNMTCLVSPNPVTPTSTVTVTVQTYAAGGITTSGHPSVPFWPRALGGTALAVLLFVLPFGRRARIFSGHVRGAVLFVLLLAGLGSAGIGCSSTTINTSVNTGTPLGQTTLKITGASNVDNTVVSHSVYLTVNVLPPGSTGTAAPFRGHRR